MAQQIAPAASRLVVALAHQGAQHPQPCAKLLQHLALLGLGHPRPAPDLGQAPAAAFAQSAQRLDHAKLHAWRGQGGFRHAHIH
jgi:hypothetical protein